MYGLIAKVKSAFQASGSQEPSAQRTLCELCRSIPIDNLPDFPNPYGIYSSEDREYIHEYDLNDSKKPLGFSHHPNLKRLQRSAAQCPLCRLILDQIELVERNFEEFKKTPDFLQYHAIGYPKFDLFLTRRKGIGPGFLVLCHSTLKDFFFLLGAIGVCAQEGMICKTPGLAILLIRTI